MKKNTHITEKLKFISATWLLAVLLLAMPAARAQDKKKSDATAKTAGAGEKVDHRPKRYSPIKYRAAIANPAFDREILPPPPPEPPQKKDPFDFKLVSATSKADSYRIVVVDKKGKYQVITDKPDDNGYHYVGIEPSTKIQDFRVEIVQGTQREWVDFDTKRFSIAAKVPIAKQPANTRGRPNIVPNRTTSARTSTPQGGKSTARATTSKGASAIQKANAAAKSSQESSKSRVSGGRRVVLPPKNR